MRLIGTLPNEQIACRFADYLLTHGVNVMVEEGTEQWTVWVENDDHVERAKSELERYRQNPDAPQYAAARCSCARILVA
jgi:GlpG protein